MIISATLDILNARDDFRAHTEQQARLVATGLADFSADAIYFRDIDKVEDNANLVFGQSGLAYVRIVDGEGRTLAVVSEGDKGSHFGPLVVELERQSMVTFETAFQFDGNDAVAAHPIIIGGELRGVVEVGFIGDALTTDIKVITLRHLRQTGGMVAVSLLIAFFLGRRLSRPITRLETAVSQFAGREIATEVTPEGPRELKHLAQAFNAMGSRLRSAYAEIDRNQEDLEERVTERTLELEVLSEVGSLFASDMRVDDSYNAFASTVLRLLPETSLSVGELDEESHNVLVTAAHGAVPNELAQGRELSTDETLWRDAMAAEEPNTLLLDSQDPISVSDGESSASKWELLIVPLTSRGMTIGLLIFARSNERSFSDRDQSIARSVGTQIASALANWRLNRRVIALGEERERLLNEEKAELQRIDQSKNEFLSNLSHELKTPLTSVLAFTEILKKNNSRNLVEQQIQQLELVNKNGRRLDDLIGDLLDLSRIETARMKLTREQFNVGELLREMDLSFQPIFSTKTQEFTLEIGFSDAWYYGDRSRMAQVISNLLSNASKYSNSGAHINLTAGLEGTDLSIYIEDNGIGIKSEELTRVFDLFYRADGVEESNTPGAGIGLYVSQIIVELHGGSLSMKSELGVGTTAIIELPGVTRTNPTPPDLQRGAYRSRFDDMEDPISEIPPTILSE
ncbi:MAG: GAF domain-containing protein [Chloroflexi bacterium]|nr:GAF domain-containing protein [Chloroflexota bacterium]